MECQTTIAPGKFTGAAVSVVGSSILTFVRRGLSQLTGHNARRFCGLRRHGWRGRANWGTYSAQTVAGARSRGRSRRRRCEETSRTHGSFFVLLRRKLNLCRASRRLVRLLHSPRRHSILHRRRARVRVLLILVGSLLAAQARPKALELRNIILGRSSRLVRRCTLGE